MKSFDTAYRKTVYRVYLGNKIIDLRVGHKNKYIDKLLKKNDLAYFVLITAENPGSVLSSSLENKKKTGLLEKDLAMNEVYNTEHIDPEGIWPVEKGFAFPANGINYSLDLAKKYKQNALLIYDSSRGAYLKYSKEMDA